MILVVGGSNGLGLEIAKVFSETKKVKVIGRSFETFPAISSLEKINLDLLNDLQYDDLDKKFSNDSFEAIFFTLGLINNEDNIFLESNEIDKIIKTNFSSIVKFTQFLIDKKKLKTNCLICFCSSVTTFYSRDKQIIYAASKNALNSYVNSLRFYVKKNKLSLRISNLILGYLDSNMSNLNYSAPFQKYSNKKLAIYIFNNHKNLKTNKIIPSYWIMLKIILKFLPIKLAIYLFNILKV